MHEVQASDGGAARERAAEAGRVVEWLGARDRVERALESSLGGLPCERDETVSRMADVLQATARGLGPEAAAVWAGVPDRVLQGWLAGDPAFAAALEAAAALAAAHGLEAGGSTTPAMVRVVVLALSRGATWPEALAVAGFAHRSFRRLSDAHPLLAALVEAARRARPRRSKKFVPATYRPRRPGQASPRPNAFRLVQRDDAKAPPLRARSDSGDA
ncbi:hypothetical protein ACFXA3_28615 [Streptomyces sp. NPDC059456]|uniref:hypothetical protein n=1 Tax=Streptomyces sp. NPDC059456 TaxID=3346838 RepID=UPI0036A61B82